MSMIPAAVLRSALQPGVRLCRGHVQAPSRLDWGLPPLPACPAHVGRLAAMSTSCFAHNCSYGPGAGTDFLRGEGPTSVIHFDDVTWRRRVCLPSDEGDESITAAAAKSAANLSAIAAPRGGAAGGGSGGAAPGPAAPVMASERVCIGGECYDRALKITYAKILGEPRAQDLGTSGEGDAGSPAPSGTYLWVALTCGRLCGAVRPHQLVLHAAAGPGRRARASRAPTWLKVLPLRRAAWMGPRAGAARLSCKPTVCLSACVRWAARKRPEPKAKPQIQNPDAGGC